MSDVSVGFGAVDEGLAQAMRKLQGDLAGMERAQGRVGGATAVASRGMAMMGRSMLGPLASLARFGQAAVPIIAVGAAWMVASKGARAYAEINEEAARRMEVAELRAKGLWQTLGKLSDDSLGFNVLNPMKAMEQGIASWVGVDPAVQRAHFDAMMKSQREALEIALARDDGERAFLRALQMETAEYEKQKQVHLNMQKAGLITERHRAGLDRALGDTHRARIDDLFARENERKGKALEDERKAQEELRQQAMKAREESREQMWQIMEKVEADRQRLEILTAEARIDTMLAQGKEKEARIEQLRLQTLEKIRDIKSREYAMEADRAAAIAAVQEAEKAQLARLEEPAFTRRRAWTGTQAISAGLSSAALTRQVFGGEGGNRQERTLQGVSKELVKQTAVLKSIEGKLAGVGTLAP